MASKRRYKLIKDSEKAYHNRFDDLRMNSIILNADARRKSNRGMNFGNREDLKKLLVEWADKQKAATLTIHTINNKHKQENEVRCARGRAKIEMPDKLKNEILRAESLCDVLLEEVEEITKLIDNIGIEEAQRTSVLRFGCKGSGIIKGGTLAVLDGQNIDTRMMNFT